MGVVANEPKAETPFAAGPVILNVQSSLRLATLTDEIVEFGAWRVFAKLALGYGHDPNSVGAADPEGRGPFPNAASEATTRTTIPRLRPGRLLSTDPVRLRPDRGRRVVSDSPLKSVQNVNRSNTCPTPISLSDALCPHHHGHTPRVIPHADNAHTSLPTSHFCTDQPGHGRHETMDPHDTTRTTKPIRLKVRTTITTAASAGRTTLGQATPPCTGW